jgi:glycosyltransferase involved in cell wall biosynthesis
MQREKPDVVLSWLYHADLIALIANRLSGHLPLVWNLRCSYMDFAAYPKTTAMTVKTCARLSALPDAVIANSAEALQSHRHLGYRPRKTAVIPNGFDTARFRPDADAALRLRNLVGANEDDSIVGMVGRYDHMKDHATFLKAAAHALGRWPSLRFVLCGEGVDWNNDELASLIRRHGIANRVWLFGRQQDMPSFMAGLDMLVLSSRGESFPNVLGEAMACAVPCITTDVGAAAGIVADTGFVCRVGDAECLSRGMLRLVSYVAAERERIGRRARKRVQEHYDISTVADQYLSFLNSVRK